MRQSKNIARDGAVILIRAVMLGFLVVASCSSGTARLTNVRFETKGSLITIQYDVVLDERSPRMVNASHKGMKDEIPFSGDDLKVALILRKESDPQFSYTPEKVTGDVGIGHFLGKNMKILWDTGEEFPNGLEGSDYYFEVSGEPIARVSKGPYLWIGAGAALLAGSIVTYVILSGGEESPQPGGFPYPPGRPK